MRKKLSGKPKPVTGSAAIIQTLSQIPWWQALLVGSVTSVLFYFGLSTFFAQQSHIFAAHPIPFETFIAVSQWIGIAFAITAFTCALLNGAGHFSQRKHAQN